jgi:quinol monooxygenase YgiN
VRLVVMRFTARTGDGTRLVEALEAVLPDTAAFPGCFGVELCRDADDGDQVTMIERWETPQAYDAYLDWRAKQEPTQVGPLLDRPAQRSLLDLQTAFVPPGATLS